MLNEYRSKYFVHWPTAPANTVLLSSMGRSGSTWVASLINYSNTYRVIFEPFLPKRVPEANCFEYCQYIRQSDRTEKLIVAARNILEGRLKRQKWIDVDNTKFWSTKRLIKDIRTNLMLGWFTNHFPEMKIILLIRNPFSVVQSYMNLGWGREPCGFRREIDILLGQELLLNDFPEIAINSKSIDLSNDFECLMFQWCVLNYVPITQLTNSKVHVTFYENYLLQPENELSRLYSYLNSRMNNEVIVSLNLPSRTSYNKKKFSIGKPSFEDATILRGMEILKMFNLDKMYDDNFRPVLSI